MEALLELLLTATLTPPHRRQIVEDVWLTGDDSSSVKVATDCTLAEASTGAGGIAVAFIPASAHNPDLGLTGARVT